MKSVSMFVAAAAITATIPLGNAALAADISIYEPPPVAIPAPAPYSWTGLYAGLNGAYGWGNSDAEFEAPGFLVDDPDNPALDLPLRGAVVGGTLGYNWQASNNFVLGIEGDIAAGKISGTGTYDPSSSGGFIPPTLGEYDLDWLATVRGRLGFASGNTLFYLTGGAAWAQGHRWINNEVVNPASFSSATHTGWTAGIGFEHAINDRWSVKGEYLYADLGRKNYVDNSGSGVITSVHPTVSLIRFGVNLKLY